MMPSTTPTSAPTTSFYSCQMFAGDVFLGVPDSTGDCGAMLDELTTAIMSCQSASTNMPFEASCFHGVVDDFWAVRDRRGPAMCSEFVTVLMGFGEDLRPGPSSRSPRSAPVSVPILIYRESSML